MIPLDEEKFQEAENIKKKMGKRKIKERRKARQSKRIREQEMANMKIDYKLQKKMEQDPLEGKYHSSHNSFALLSSNNLRHGM